MHYISMLNPYSIYHLYQYKYGRIYINKIINSIIKTNENYELLDFFNMAFNSVRSYCIFESSDSIVLLDFNLNGRSINDDLGIINILEATSTKDIKLIMLHNFKGTNFASNGIYNIFKSEDILFADSTEKQLELNSKVAKILYLMTDEMFRLYLHEENLLLNMFD